VRPAPGPDGRLTVGLEQGAEVVGLWPEDYGCALTGGSSRGRSLVQASRAPRRSRPLIRHSSARGSNLTVLPGALERKL
jgi:hypothetical protein